MSTAAVPTDEPAPISTGTQGPTDTTATAPTPTTPADELLALHRSGRLAAEYPRLKALLAQLDEDRSARAAQLLARVDPDEVLRAHPSLPALTVAITGHGTLSALVPALALEGARHGIVLRTVVSDFDSYVFDLADPGSALHAASPDLVLCLLDPMIVRDELPSPWRPEDVEAVLAEKTALLEGLVSRFAGSGSGTLVLNTLPLPRDLVAQLVDHRSRARLGVLWREANIRLLRLAETHPELVVLDLDPIAGEGVEVTDARLSVYAKAHLSPRMLSRYAREAGHLARLAAGQTKKCLAVDLDQTLWGGVLGDDGPEGIEVGDGPRGAAFAAFQKVVGQLASQGVLLAAVSKNDLGPVRDVLANRTEMALREEDFVRLAVNWRPKHENIAELAADLNLAVDSVVFADDSAYECGLVRRELPGVAVVQLDEEPARHIGKLLRDGWFDTRELTTEDRARPALYRSEAERKDFLHTFDSLQDYLRELGVRVEIGPVADADVPRVSQLTLRTNQFNLTTRRLQPAEVRALAEGPDTQVLAVRSGDRFGDNGLVGAVFLRREGSTVHIDNFLLSCRVFARGIEQAALTTVLRRARADGAREVVGYYRESAKNAKVQDFYPANGFTRTGGAEDVGERPDEHGDEQPDAHTSERPGEQPDASANVRAFRHDLAGIPRFPTTSS
ncbi:HAD-IIIC family phosphatase [Streptomyces sp. Ac-502]|uniref:HAD-IIIC family phosphatase n=1 Tax=Streptomyces sp. Ac-502 TaxID=3342801 RepID=UPI003862AFA9